MSNTVVTVKMTKDDVEKCNLTGSYFLGVLVQTVEKEDGEEVECRLAELGQASVHTRVRAIDCLSKELEEKKREIILSTFPKVLEGLLKSHEEVEDGDSE